MTTRCAASSQPYGFSIVAYLDDVDGADYFELFVTSSSNGDEVLIEDLNIYFEAV